MKNRTISRFTFFAAALAGVQVSTAAVLITENFGGLVSANLSGTTADTFDSALTTAGGSSTWVAQNTFKADGSVLSPSSDSAYLNVGSYINSSKGTANGKFIATATLDYGTLGSWIGFGFFRANTPDADGAFTVDGSDGSGILIYRGGTSNVLDGFGGYKTALPVDGGSTEYTGPQILTIILDLTPAGGYNGSSNFGDITFIQGNATTGTPLGKAEYTTNQTFGSFGLTATTGGSNNNGFASSLQLEQVPEPSTALLGALGSLLLLRRRR